MWQLSKGSLRRADHGVDHLAVTEPLPETQAGQPVLRPAHALGAAGDCRLRVALQDQLGGGDDRLEAAAAKPVHGQRRRLHG
jgi:hypothetical protein